MSLEQHRAESSDSLRFAIITFSDTRDEASDAGGSYLVERLTEAGHQISRRALHPDEPQQIEAAVRGAVLAPDVDLVLTTGGTGISPRDRTVPVLEQMFAGTIPGFGELFRHLSFEEIGSAAILSRATAGLVAGKVVMALPGSPKALRLALDRIILPEAGHLVSQTTAQNRKA